MYRKYLPVILLPFLMLSSCGKESSESKFKKATGIELPEGFTVMNESRVETGGEEYNLVYEVRLSLEGMPKFSKDIRSSHTFSAKGKEDTNVWVQKGNGYSFYLTEKGIYYSVTVDTISRIVTYNEAG